jgi:anion-transporting  ArsA/GET3 family ATPase
VDLIPGETDPRPGAPFDMDAWLAETRLVVCVGAGGVGKTTTAATFGLCGAMRGRRALVLTIDPARRLANSLGLKSIGNEETKIDLEALGLQPGLSGSGAERGELWAMMLDSRSTFDSLIARVATDPAARERILNNHVYRHMADTFAGSQDYMATEKLYDLVVGGKYDLLVLDTPPVKNALDFLESPGRLINFLDERVLRWFLQPQEGGAFGRLMFGTSAVVNKLLSYVFGKDFLDDLTTFFEDFQGLYQGFVERHQSVVELFRAPSTSFVTICAPTESSLDVATFFQEELARRDLPRGGVVVNQVHACRGESHDAKATLGPLAEGLGSDLPPSTVPAVLARLGMAHRRLHALRVAEEALTARLRVHAKGGGFYQELPRLDGNVHDLEALSQVGARLFGPAGTL